MSTSQDMIFSSQSSELLRFLEKNHSAGTDSKKKRFLFHFLNESHVNGTCDDGSNVNGGRESIVFAFRLFTPAGFNFFEEPFTSIFKKVNKETIVGITFCVEDDVGQLSDFNVGTLTFAVMIDF